jgi:hypothetical protein
MSGWCCPSSFSGGTRRRRQQPGTEAAEDIVQTQLCGHMPLCPELSSMHSTLFANDEHADREPTRAYAIFLLLSATVRGRLDNSLVYERAFTTRLGLVDLIERLGVRASRKRGTRCVLALEALELFRESVCKACAAVMRCGNCDSRRRKSLSRIRRPAK